MSMHGNYEMKQLINYLDDVNALLDNIEKGTLEIKDKTTQLYNEFRDSQYSESVNAITHFCKEAIDEHNDYMSLEGR